MKIVIANGKKTLKMSKNEWQQIGKTAGWVDRPGKNTVLVEDGKPLSNPQYFGGGDESIKRSVKVTFDDGDVIHTNINGTKEEIENYYLKHDFIKSDEKSKHRGVKVEFLGEEKNYSCAMCGRKSTGPNELCYKCTMQKEEAGDETGNLGGTPSL